MIKATALLLKAIPNPCNKYPLTNNSSNVVWKGRRKIHIRSKIKNGSNWKLYSKDEGEIKYDINIIKELSVNITRKQWRILE